MKSLLIIMLSLSLFGTHLKKGDLAPGFSLKNPKAFTPGWTKQACGFRDESKNFEDLNISVVGVSYDSENQLKLFKDKYSLPFDLLSDPKKIMGSAYGVNSFYFFAQRKTFLIDESGSLVHIFEDVNLNSHPDDILKVFNK